MIALEIKSGKAGIEFYHKFLDQIGSSHDSFDKMFIPQKNDFLFGVIPKKEKVINVKTAKRKKIVVIIEERGKLFRIPTIGYIVGDKTYCNINILDS